VVEIPMEALAEATRLVGDRWSPLVLAALGDGPRRYGDLARAIPGISSNVLAQRLAALEQHRLVVAEPYSRRPLRVRYALTDAGTELGPALTALAAWGAQRTPGAESDEHVEPLDDPSVVQTYLA
jgi:DNA-binding HxlR family transcriptional regulator